MGEAAAVSLLERIANSEIRPREILVIPELIVRESTSAPGVEDITSAPAEAGQVVAGK
jgi:hypothetical protein